MKRYPLILFLALCLPGGSHAYQQINRTLYRSDGSQTDASKAVNAIPSGGTVEIPNGTWTWAGTLIIHKPVILKGQTKGNVTISAKDARSDVIQATEATNGNIEIANLNVDYTKANDCWPFFIRASQGSPRGSGRILVHDCSFRTNYAYAIVWATNGGVVWNCVFDGQGSSGLTGISFVGQGNNADWRKASSLGALDADGLQNTYIEDCSFNNINTACMNFDDNSRVVVRHCAFTDAAIASHGQETSIEGARQWEVYNNKFECNSQNAENLNYYISIRGGTGVFTDNNLQDIPFGKAKITLNVFSIRRRGQIPCQTQYPAARQVGQGWKGAGGYSYRSVPRDGNGYFTDPMYFWGNTGAGASSSSFISLNEYNPDECGNGMKLTDFVKRDRDYLTSARPGYVKFTYPHPLRSGTAAPRQQRHRRTATASETS